MRAQLTGAGDELAKEIEKIAPIGLLPIDLMHAIASHYQLPDTSSMRILPPFLYFALIGGNLAPATAADTPSFTLTLKEHQFEPAEMQVPANQKIELRVVNTDSTAEEFESLDLHREKVVAGNREITLFVGPLKPGSYEFFGDFNPKTARGHLIAR